MVCFASIRPPGSIRLPLSLARRASTAGAGLLLAAGLAACNPIDTWRSISGVSRNDPDPQTTPNTQNLAKAEGQPYPNLASVPAPPVSAMTAAERDKLTKSLIADRANARYNGEKLQPGFPANNAVPPPPPAPPKPKPEVPAAAAAAPAPPAAATAPAEPTPAEPTPAEPTPAEPTPAAATPGKPAEARGPGRTAERKPGEPPAPGPMESSLQMPQTRPAPQPDTARAPPPPPPGVKPLAAPPPAENTTPAAMASTTPRPVPPPPAIAPAAAPPPPPPAALPAAPPPSPSMASTDVPAPREAKRPTAPMTVLSIDFPSAGAGLTAADRNRLNQVAGLYREQPGTVRVVAYAAPGKEQLDSYRAALGRAQEIAKVLANTGIPAAKIVSEAAPSRTNAPAGRVDVQLAP
jgi:outer membrane protein OmpA-like peptidoglycan-associated protein